jgi:hypothetical protein
LRSESIAFLFRLDPFGHGYSTLLERLASTRRTRAEFIPSYGRERHEGAQPVVLDFELEDPVFEFGQVSRSARTKGSLNIPRACRRRGGGRSRSRGSGSGRG